MKHLFTLSAALLTAATMSADVVTLDLTASINPEVVTYDEATHKWVETYNDDAAYQWLVYGTAEDYFMLSHIANGASYGGYYWDGFVPALGGDDTDFGVDETGESVGSSNDWISNAWGCMAGGGVLVDEDGEVVDNGDGTAQADPDAPYIVGYWGYYGSGNQTNQVMFQHAADETFKPLGVYVCNSPWPYYGTVHGDGFARAFAEGDSFVLHAFGVHQDGTTTETTFTLIEYTGGELIAANDWTYFDLSSLGDVTSVYFTLVSTDTGYGGYNNTSNMFCMDKFQVEIDGDTGIQDATIDRQATGKQYYNLSGQSSSTPFDGVNIVVTTYSDGTTSTVKVIK